jgi:hypothetical protein
MDRDKYLTEAHRQMSDESFYKTLQSDPTEEFSTKITETLQKIYDKGEVGDNVFETLCPNNCRPGQFNLLPKIHKKDMPGRPTVSVIGHPTEKISEFIVLHLRQHVDLQSYLKDTTDYLNKTPSSGLPDHTIL